jgi:hypothetical protein
VTTHHWYLPLARGLVYSTLRRKIPCVHFVPLNVGLICKCALEPGLSHTLCQETPPRRHTMS